MTWVAVVLLCAAAIYRLYMLRRHRNIVSLAYAVAVSALAAAFIVKALRAAIDAGLGPYVSDLSEHGFVVAAAFATQLFLLALRTGELPRRPATMRLTVATLVLVALIATFAAAPIHQQYTGDLDVAYGDLGVVALNRLLLDVYLGYVLVDNVRLCRRYSSKADDIGVNLSFVFVGWGSAIALMYAVSRILYVLLDVLMNVQSALLRAVGSVGAAVGLSTIAIGVLAPRLGSVIDRWIEAARNTRRLRPLWADLTLVFPKSILRTPVPITLSRAEWRYDRYRVEIADGLAGARVTAAPSDHSVTALASALCVSRANWAGTSGITAAELLPPINGLDDERSQLLALADAYRRIRHTVIDQQVQVRT
jgi:hypothetical protein